jgi:hypothetical protein
MCLSGSCSICQRDYTPIATEKTMLDLTKPLTVVGWGDFHYIGKDQDGRLIVETTGSHTIYRADPKTFKICCPKDYYLTNKLEPWEEAWKVAKCRDSYMMEKDYFKYVFELGRSWK